MNQTRGSSSKLSFYLILLLILMYILITILSIVMVTGDFDPSASNENGVLPLVVTTWKFTNATKKAWASLKNGKSVLDAVEHGCTVCEEEQCDFTVGFGGSPDEKGETTLDAMIIDGTTMNMGAVCGLRRIKNAIGVARKVLENTEHSILAGELATEFAKMVGFKEESLSTADSTRKWKEWKLSKCQPNSWINVKPDPRQSCGPYSPTEGYLDNEVKLTPDVGEKNHDTITMIAIGEDQKTAVGTSSNGKNHKIPGRVGDAPIAGAGGFADSRVGAAAATGDGDVMMRFLPSFYAVEEMRSGASPTEAAEKAIKRISDFYPNFFGALIAANVNGEYGAACNGMEYFPFNVVNPVLNEVVVKTVKCTNFVRSSE